MAFHRRTRFVWLFIAGAIPATAQAKGGDEDLLAELNALLNTKIEVSSTRAQTIFTAPSTVSIIDRDTIDRYGWQTLGEAVESVSGFTNERQVFDEEITTARGVLQEGYNNRILILVNGVSTWNSLTGSGYLDRISVRDVERIEVLKGPASVLYGSNAYAGAINIILKRPENSQLELQGGILDQGGNRRSVNWFQKGNNWSFYLSASTYREIGQRFLLFAEPAGVAPNPINFQDRRFYTNQNVQFTFGKADGAGEFSFLYNRFNIPRTWYGANINFVSGGGQTWENFGDLSNFTYNLRKKKLSLKYALTYDVGRRDADTTASGVRNFEGEAYRLVNEVKVGVEFHPQFNMEFGSTHEKRRNNYFRAYDPNTGALVGVGGNTAGLLVPATELIEYSLFTQANWHNDKLNAVVGLRYTNNENFGGNISSRATLVWSLSNQQSIKFIYGQSYRSPSIFDQYVNIPSVVVGNTNLQPETAQSFEVGWLLSKGPMFLQVLAYAAEYKDKNYRIPRPAESPLPAGTAVLANGKTFRGQGLEVELKYNNSKTVDFWFSGDLQKGNDGDEEAFQVGYNFKFVPSYDLKGGIARTWFKGFSTSFYVIHQSAVAGIQSIPSGATIVQVLTDLPSWTNTGATVQYTHQARKVQLRHQLSFRNLADRIHYYPEYTRRRSTIADGLDARAAYNISVVF